MSKVVLVTGGTRGIGEGVARRLGREGWTVVISGRNVEKGSKVVKDIETAGGKASFIAADLSQRDQVIALHDKILSTHGRLDAAINNAGITVGAAPFAEQRFEDLENAFTVNVFSVFWCMQAQIKAMLPNKRGAIVNMASTGGLHGVPGCGIYTASKHAVIGFTRTAALDYAKDGITISAVAPACIRTDMMQGFFDEGLWSEEQAAAFQPVGHLGEVDDVAKAVSYLLDSPFVTGTVLEVDGGISAK
ncbi:hypothetical protein AAFC00_006518 [Neodothiora populina]|uniref:Ketoreductase domain-containing protein n=1 Tax=Neodothiora populina TaxID=2781224 RepID=A0ABR3PA77_9PEZI